MISAQRARRAGLRAAAAVLTLVVLCGTARADMSWRIHDAGEVLASFTRASGNGLVFDDPAGGAWDLVTSIDDPAITNRGSGRFHPVDARVVNEALKSLQADTPGLVNVNIYILPYPRRGLMASSTEQGRIYLSPGTYPRTEEQVHALVVHELGHVVHQRLLPDSNGAAWNRYRELRGIGDTAVYHEGAAHRNRPNEIFAEDFRVLFGGERANYSGSIENAALALPGQVPGLRAFMISLAPRQTPVTLAVWPNPLRAGGTLSIRFHRAASDGSTHLRIIDSAGRLVRSLRVDPEAAEGQVTWDGRNEDGRSVASGFYFAALGAGADRSVVRLAVLR